MANEPDNCVPEDKHSSDDSQNKVDLFLFEGEHSSALRWFEPKGVGGVISFPGPYIYFRSLCININLLLC